MVRYRSRKAFTAYLFALAISVTLFLFLQLSSNRVYEINNLQLEEIGTKEIGNEHDLCSGYVPHLAYESSFAPHVSIITTIHNVNATLFARTADCVLRQTFQSWEWIIMDDHSIPLINVSLLRRLVSGSSRLKLYSVSKILADTTGIQVSDRNLAVARNLGAKLSLAPFIVFLDDDDLMDPTTLEKWFWYLQFHPSSHFVGSFVRGFGAYNYIWAGNFNPSVRFRSENVVVINSMHRRRTFLEINGFAAKRGKIGLEDWQLWFQYANNTKWGHTLPETLIWYRRRGSHTDRWPSHKKKGIEQFKLSMQAQFPRLLHDSFWPPAPTENVNTFSFVNDTLFSGIETYNATVKHVLFIIPWIVLGGADKFNLLLIEGLITMGWRCTVVTTLPSDNPWLGRLKKITSDVVILHHIVPQIYFPFLVRNLIAVRQVNAVFISNSFHGYAMLPYLRKVYPRVVFSDYNHMAEDYWRMGGHARMGVTLQECLDIGFVASEDLRTWMISKNANAAKLHVAYVGVDFRSFSLPNLIDQRLQYRNKLGIPADAVVVLYACRFVAQKQPVLAMHAFIQTLRRLYNMSGAQSFPYFVFAGSGELEKDMRSALNDNVCGMLSIFKMSTHFCIPIKALSFFLFIGPVTIDTMPFIMLISDILVLPSSMEGIPTTFFEAMAMDVVIVAADVGGSSELVTHNKTGLLVKFEDMQTMSLLGQSLTVDDHRFSGVVDLYADNIFQLVINPKFRMELSANARLFIKRFDIQHTVKVIDSKLSSLLLSKSLHVHNQTNKNYMLELELYKLASLTSSYEGHDIESHP